MRLMLLFFLLVLGVVTCMGLQRKLTFYPTHRRHDNNLTPWLREGVLIGYARIVHQPRNVWLMLHGNAGQAADRLYAVPSFSPEDSVFIMEYPGYGRRTGKPSSDSFNRAAAEAYQFLRESYPEIPVCVAAESIGSGPAATLATQELPPDKIVLIVPFSNFLALAEEHFPAWLVRIMVRDSWDNCAALSRYRGPVDIFGAEADRVVPIGHARMLAEAVPGARLIIIKGGHNDWSLDNRVMIRHGNVSDNH